MANKFPKVSTFTTQKLSASRVAVFKDGEYICQLRPSEVSSWMHKAERHAKKFAEDEASITVTRIKLAIEYLHARKSRVSAVFAESQLSMF